MHEQVSQPKYGKGCFKTMMDNWQTYLNSLIPPVLLAGYDFCQTVSLSIQFKKFSKATYSAWTTLKMDAASSSKESVTNYQLTQQHIQ
jgi:hypothetical protein